MRSRLRTAAGFLGRTGLAFAVLLVGYAVLGLFAPGGLARAVVLLGLVAVGAWLVIRLLRLAVRYATWRLRNRLLVTYTFIAVVPVALIAGLVALGGYSLLSQLAIYLVTSELDRRIETLSLAARSIAEIRPERRAELTPRLLDLPKGESPSGVALLLREQGRLFRFPSDAALTAPPAGWRTTRGVMIREGRAYLWSYTKTEAGDLTVTVPITRSFLAGLVPDLGLVDLGRVGAQLRLANTAPAQPAERELPPSANRFDTEVQWFAAIPAADWDRPGQVLAGTEGLFIVVRTRVSAVLSAVFNRAGDVAQGAIQIALVAGVVVFVIVEIASLLIGIGLTRTITGAVHRLYEGTQKVMSGDFSHRIEVSGNDQLAELGHSFNRMTANVERLLAVAKEKERLQSELEIASEVQTHLYPRVTPQLRYLRITGVCHPARLVSGDYYDYVAVDNSRVVLAVGDVAGKGISAALLMATLQSALRTDLQSSTDGALSTARLVTKVNRHLYATTAPEKYATFCLGVYDDSSGVLVYTNAGHLPPAVVRKDEVRRCDVNGMVVGAFPAAAYEESRLTLEPGDLLVMFTDGVTEPENQYGEMFGEERFLEIVMRNQHRNEPEILAAVVAGVKEWTGSEELQDDLTLLLARRL